MRFFILLFKIRAHEAFKKLLDIPMIYEQMSEIFFDFKQMYLHA